MCRWFTYLSPTEPCLLEDVLVTPANSLSKQVLKHYLPGIISPEDIRRNRNFNIDGLGVAWYSSARDKFELLGPKGQLPANFKKSQSDDALTQFHFEKPFYPTLYKSLIVPLSNPSFMSICANTTTTTLMAHVRASLPAPSKPIPVLSDYNCHPFSRGKYCLMHNGSVGDFARTRREVMNAMGEVEAAWINGDTDTEALAGVFYYLLGKETGKGPEAKVLQKTVNLIFEIQQNVVKDVSLRQLVKSSSKLTLHTISSPPRFCNSTDEDPLSLYLSTTAGATLDNRYEGHPDGPNEAYPRPVPEVRLPPSAHAPHVIIASEPMTYKKDEWTLIPNNKCILVDKYGKYKQEDFEILPKYFLGPPVMEPGPAKPPKAA